MKFDLHLHTRRHSPDAVTDPFDLVRRRRPPDWTASSSPSTTTSGRRTNSTNCGPPPRAWSILAGMEVTGRGGDVLCTASPTRSRCRGASGGANCAARSTGRAGRPWRPTRTGGASRSRRCCASSGAELDGIEVMSNNMDRDLRRRAAELLTKYPHFAQLGNSDSHAPETVGCCYTDFDAEIRTSGRPGGRDPRAEGRGARELSNGTRMTRMKPRG